MIAPLLVLLVLPLGYWTLIWFTQRSLLYPAPPASAGVRAPHDTEVVWLETPSGPAEAWLLPPLRPGVDSSGRGPAILFAHGNAELIDHLESLIRETGAVKQAAEQDLIARSS